MSGPSIDIIARVRGHQIIGFLPVVALAYHRLPPRKGKRNTVGVQIKYRPIVDASRYPGAKLRAIRADGEHR